MSNILVINGSYRDDGTTDQTLTVMAQWLRSAGARVDQIQLRHYPIEFCLNCRECTQLPGSTPGTCVQHDGMAGLIDQIEQADGIILASPTNFGSVTALFKRFMERLVVYAYWPWQQHFPVLRKAKCTKKKAVLVSSSAAPGLMGRWLFSSLRQLKQTADVIGAKPVAKVFSGRIATNPEYKLDDKLIRKAQEAATRLL